MGEPRKSDVQDVEHSTGDSEVLFEFSETLSQQIKAAGRTVEFYSYPGDDHNIANSFRIPCNAQSSSLTSM